MQYDRLAGTELFRSGLKRVVQGSEAHRIALMCAEKDPLTCHRTILVSRHLVEQGLAVSHILDDGSLESHEEALERLLGELGIESHDLFQLRRDAISEAYARRGDRIAYVAKPARDQR